MRVYKEIHTAIMALKQQVEDAGREAKYLHLSPSVAEEIEACNGDTYEGMMVCIKYDLSAGEALITGGECELSPLRKA